MHENTKWVMDWADRMVKRFGQPYDDFDWCRRLAYAMGEEGFDIPSNMAINIAKDWEKNPHLYNFKEV